MQTHELEQHLLKVSILVTSLMAASGIVFGLYCRSQSIVFDGLFNAIDSSMAFLSLVVARLLVKGTGRRFQTGYWHIEPLALALNGSVLLTLCAYGFVNAISSFLQGGHSLVFDGAIVYTAVTALVCALMHQYVRRRNRKVQSELIELDVQSWWMSMSITTALLLAFVVGYVLQDGPYAFLTPYIDPGIMAVLALALMPGPAKTVIKAVSQILKITPSELDGEISRLMTRMSQRYGFEAFTHSALQIGRGFFVEIHIVLPEAMNAWRVTELDQVRAEIADGIGREGPNRWITIGFTRDRRWI
ncbi:cation transporter [Pseudomonas sp. LS1212]|uniref:cation diffusion facilitator family transporter n=1 Tax=Pseudomonas sp. LS1212 TaxID=2972478 RepID=UPI00215D01D0|nr:cation transporter [Pseudomonas sp. LS1212]UVJ45661.1 cation transporter [Pseudomonas sp. LS1212]